MKFGASLKCKINGDGINTSLEMLRIREVIEGGNFKKQIFDYRKSRI
ncbi:MAG: hypothetical protein ACRC7N_21980 [Clostridium sp.]